MSGKRKRKRKPGKVPGTPKSLDFGGRHRKRPPQHPTKVEDTPGAGADLKRYSDADVRAFANRVMNRKGGLRR